MDLVIRNALVVDGTGARGHRADVGIDGPRIVAIGDVDARGDREIDAEGHVVAPGFIDAHTHMDAQLFWDPLGTPSSYHGVTTAIIGNCGFSLAPVQPGREDLIIHNFERAEDIPATAIADSVPFNWVTTSDFLDALGALPKALNIGSYLGHSALRTYVLGDEAFDRAATPDEVSSMQLELRGAMAAGAVGFSTSRSPHHTTWGDRPVASRLASWDELNTLAMELGRCAPGRVCELALDGGSFAIGADAQRESFEKWMHLALTAGVPLSFGITSMPYGPDLLRFAEATRAAGGRVIGQTNSRGPNQIVSFLTHLPFDLLPGWQAVRTLPLDGQVAALRDPERRAELVAEAYEGAYPATSGAETKPPDFEQLRLVDDPAVFNPSIAELARAQGSDPVNLMIDLALERGLDAFFSQHAGSLDVDRIQSVLEHPQTVLTFSDAGAHVSQLLDASIQSHLLAYWVRERGAFSLEAAVAMMTSAIADAWGLRDRGRVEVGAYADLVVFDPATVGPDRLTVEHDLPGGLPRLSQRATGFLATIIQGVVVLDAGQHTGALPGQLVRLAG